MKLVIFLVLGTLALASGEGVLDGLRNLKILSEGKHEPLLEKLASVEAKITPEMFIDAIQKARETILTNTDEEEGNGVTEEDMQCIAQLLALIDALQANIAGNLTLWPLWMVDPWAKIQSGFAAGNIRNPGHFTQCINLDVPISEAAGNLRGRHCTLGIRGYIESDYELPGGIIPAPPIIDIGSVWPEGLFLDLGICFPAPCRLIVVDTIVRLLLAYLGLEPTTLFTNNREAFCSTAETPPLTGLSIGALVLIGLGFAGCIISTIYELICLKLKIKPSEMAAAMSVYSNGRYLFNLRRKKGQIQCLYGLRALSLIWLMLGYRYLLSMILPLINPLDFIFDFSEGYFSSWVFGSQYGIDTILFLNATLITFLFMCKIERTGNVRIWKMYIYRIMRVTPFVGIVIFFLMTLTKYSSDGPYYSFLTEAQIPNCEQYWWSAMLHVQNYVNPESLCVLHTWMFSVDMQMYWVAPLLLFPLFFIGPWILMLIAVIVGLTIACAATVSYFYGFNAFLLNMLLDGERLTRFLRMIFFATHIRMGPWLIGMACGYLCWRVKDGRTRINWLFAALLWIASISGIIAVIFLMHPFQQILNNETGEIANILYIGFARNIFTLCLLWWVIGCFTGSGYIINWILSLSIWMPLSRMGLSVYIVSLSAQMVIIASQKTPLVFGSMELLHAFDGDLVLVFIFSTVTYLMIERPIMRVMQHLFRIGRKEVEKEGIEGEHQVTFDRVQPWKSWY